MSNDTSFENVTVLIAEDDDGHAELIKDLLIEVGVRNPIQRFCDGQELLEFLRGTQSCPPAAGAFLLLLDIRMPRVDGIEVLRQMKSDDRLRAVPVIMLTTTDDPREIRSCYELGCNSYVTKPIKFEQFTSVLRQLGLFLLIVKVPELRSKAGL